MPHHRPMLGADVGTRRAVLNDDTSADAERLQTDLWRRMSPAEKAAIIRDLTLAVQQLALAGIRHRHPEASDRECFLRLAALKLGANLVGAIYPDAGAYGIGA